MSTPAGFTLLPVTVHDIPSILDANDEGFSNDPFAAYLNHADDPAEQRARTEKRTLAMVNNSHITGARYMKVVEDGTNKTVGFAFWEFPVHLNGTEKAQRQTLLDGLKAEPYPAGAHVDFLNDFHAREDAKKAEWHNPDRDIFLALLATIPSHRGRGIAKLLLFDGMKNADRLGANIYLVASPAGAPVYLRLGWDEVDEVVVPGWGEGKCMLRRPKTTVEE